MKDHDHGYKLLFSHPEMIEDLLKGYVKEDWVKRVDFGTLEKVSGSYVSDDLREREDDTIWRVRFADEWLYVYVLLEFQSAVDQFMALRVMTYLGLLYQDLVRTNGLSATGKLPPVLPVVLYNGESRWNAATDVGELVESIPGGLAKYRPSLKYLLLDEGLLHGEDHGASRNLVSALFKLEKSRSKDDILVVVESLIDWLGEPEQSNLRRAFTVWFRRVLQPKEEEEGPELKNLDEVKIMLSKRVEEWKKEAMDRVRLEGREEGREEGRNLGAAGILESQLALKFGPLDDSVIERIHNADADTLKEWGQKILTQNSLEEVFDN